MKKLLEEIITKAGILGLVAADISVAREFLEHHEFGLCLDIIVDQIYEYKIAIDDGFYHLVTQAAKEMNIPTENVHHLKELLA